MAEYSDDDALIQEFVIEGREHLATIEPDLLVLEQATDSADGEIINRVFRAIHSIKGAAGFFGFDALTQLSHVMENLLMQLRDKKMAVSPHVIEPLLAGVDKLNTMFDDIYASEHVDFAQELAQMESILAKQVHEKSPLAVDGPSAPAAAAEPESKVIDFPFMCEDHLLRAMDEAVAFGKKLYLVRVDFQADLLEKNRDLPAFFEQTATMGAFLDVAWELDALPELTQSLTASFPILFLYATVLDEDLVDVALGVPKAQITKYDAKALMAHLRQQLEQMLSVPPPAQLESLPEQADDEASSFKPMLKPFGGKKPSPGVVDSIETLRVRVDLLNRLMELAGELVLSRNQLLRAVDTPNAEIGAYKNLIQSIDAVTTDIREHVMQTRMQPVGNVFAKFPRVVRDIARQLGKEVELQMSGGDVELDKSIIESLSDPLTHIIRNCCDHAIESPEERLKMGKPRVGIICIQVFQEGGQINIAITDDGRGIDTQKIVRKAIEKGLVSEADVKRMSPQEQLNLIFLPGLSTAEQVSDLSGRGVGMDVVRTNIEKLGGHITIETVIGEGTTFMLEMPLTMAIIPSLIVGAAGLPFAIPQINLVELVCVTALDVSHRIEKVGAATVLRLRDDLIPLVRLVDVLKLQRFYFDPGSRTMRPDRRAEIADIRNLLEIPEAGFEVARQETPDNRRLHWQSNYSIVILKVGSNHFGLIVDELFDSEEIVVKPLPVSLRQCKSYAGVTLMGDGRVAMILDVAGILALSRLSFAELNEAERRREIEKSNLLASRDPMRQGYVLFYHAAGERFAFPLAAVARLEKFSLAEIERVGLREFISYRGKALPLLRLEHYLPVSPFPGAQQEAYMLVTKGPDGHGVGIVVSEIIDTVEVSVVLDTSVATDSGIQGSAILDGHLTLFIDPLRLTAKAGFNLQLSSLGGAYGQ